MCHYVTIAIVHSVLMSTYGNARMQTGKWFITSHEQCYPQRCFVADKVAPIVC